VLPYETTKSSIKTESFAMFLAEDDADEDDECFSGKENRQGHIWCSDWNVRMERYRYYKGKFGKTWKIEFQKYNWNFVCFNQIDPCTRGFLVDTCTGQEAMHDDKSTTLTEHLDGRTILMNVC